MNWKRGPEKINNNACMFSVTIFMGSYNNLFKNIVNPETEPTN